MAIQLLTDRNDPADLDVFRQFVRANLAKPRIQVEVNSLASRCMAAVRDAGVRTEQDAVEAAQAALAAGLEDLSTLETANKRAGMRGRNAAAP